MTYADDMLVSTLASESIDKFLAASFLTSQNVKASFPLIPYTPAAASVSDHCHTKCHTKFQSACPGRKNTNGSRNLVLPVSKAGALTGQQCLLYRPRFLGQSEEGVVLDTRLPEGFAYVTTRHGKLQRVLTRRLDVRPLHNAQIKNTHTTSHV